MRCVLCVVVQVVVPLIDGLDLRFENYIGLSVWKSTKSIPLIVELRSQTEWRGRGRCWSDCTNRFQTPEKAEVEEKEGEEEEQEEEEGEEDEEDEE